MNEKVKVSSIEGKTYLELEELFIIIQGDLIILFFDFLSLLIRDLLLHNQTSLSRMPIGNSVQRIVLKDSKY